MICNQKGIEIIKFYEGFRAEAYLCPAKVWTIGYGHTRIVKADMVITKDQAEVLLREDLRIVEKSIQRAVKVPLNDNQFSALASFAFNVGLANFERSTLVQLLNRGWYEAVPAQLVRWNKVAGEVMKGLTARRTAEGNLWNAPGTEESV